MTPKYFSEHQIIHFFVGPDGVRNHKVTVKDDPTYVGIGTMSREGTSSISYLCRSE